MSRLRLTILIACFVVAFGELALRTYGFAHGIRYRPHPALGWEMVPGQRAFNVRGRAVVRINSLGFRGPEVRIPRPASTYRLLFLGDGSTLANQIAEERTYPFLVRQDLAQRQPPRDVDVVVAAVGSYQLEQHAELLRERAAELAPSVVVIGFNWNDWASQTMRGPGQGPVATGEYRGRRRAYERAAVYDFATRLLRTWRHSLQARAQGAGEPLPEAREDDATWQHVSAMLDTIATIARVQQAEVVLLIIPAPVTRHDSAAFAARRARLAAWAAARGVRFADPEPVLRAAEAAGAVMHLDSAHPAAAAHPILAGAVVRALESAPAPGRDP